MSVRHYFSDNGGVINYRSPIADAHSEHLTERDAAVRLEATDLAEGSLNVEPSYVNPWSVHEVEHADVDRRVAQATDEKIRAVAEGVARFVEFQS